MINILKKQHGMTIVGQGGKIILFMLPALIAAISLHISFPRVAALPAGLSFLKILGYLFLIPGLIYWATAVIQLLHGFSGGKLVPTGAYRVARNPIYSSAAFFILPGIALLTLTWVYLAVAIFLYLGVQIFIHEEEDQLTRVFGSQYVNYMASVDRLIPFRKP